MMKAQGLGTVVAAAAGVLITGGTNATPIVATITAGHGLKNNDRIAITGVTGLTAMNGEFSLDFASATTAALRGSVGNGAFGGTAVVAVICDTTPFMPKESCVGLIGQAGGAAVFVGTVLIESSSDNVTFASALAGGEEVIPAASAGQAFAFDVVLAKYMRLRASAFTSGAASCRLISGM